LDKKPVCNNPNVPIDNFGTSNVSLASLHSQQQYNSLEEGNTKTDQQNSVSNLSLGDLASFYLNKLPSQDMHGVPSGSGGDSGGDDGSEKTSASVASFSLADLASLHMSTTVVRPHEERSSNNLSLSELASLHVSDQTLSQQSEQLLPLFSDSSPLFDTNPTATTSLDCSAGFATPKTGSTLSLSQLASLGTKSVPPTAVKSHTSQASTGGLAALATAHFSSMNFSHTSSSNPIDLEALCPPPGFNVSGKHVLKSSSLSAIVKKLTIQESDVVCVDLANASQFACILCMPEKRLSKKLDTQHRHLRKKSWKKIFNMHIRRFSFATPSPDDIILNQQKLVFTSDIQY